MYVRGPLLQGRLQEAALGRVFRVAQPLGEVHRGGADVVVVYLGDDGRRQRRRRRRRRLLAVVVDLQDDVGKPGTVSSE